MSYYVIPRRPAFMPGIAGDAFQKESGELQDLPVSTEPKDVWPCPTGTLAVQTRDDETGVTRTVACVATCPQGFLQTAELCVTPEEFNRVQTVEKIAIAEKKHRVIKTAAWGAGAAALLAFLL